MTKIFSKIFPKAQEPKIIAFDRRKLFGDIMVSIPALYLAKKLYPSANLVLITNARGKNLCQNFSFIDKIVECESSGDFGAVIDEIAPDILILGHRTSENITIANQSKCPKIISWIHLKSMFLPKFRHPLYVMKGKKREIQSCIDLIRTMNPRRFDKIIGSVALQNLPIQIQTSRENVAFVDAILGGGNYKLIIGIHCFRGKAIFNLAPRDWIALGKEIASEFSDILVVFTNHKSTAYAFPPFSEANIKVFVNNDDLLNLAELTKRFDLLLCADTGNAHLADNLKVRILELIHTKNLYRWGCGAYNNECETIALPDDWEQRYEVYKQMYFSKAKDWIGRLLGDLEK